MGTGCSGPTCPYWLGSAVSDPVRCIRPTSRWLPLLYPLAPRHLGVLIWTSETCPICVWLPSSRVFAMLKYKNGRLLMNDSYSKYKLISFELNSFDSRQLKVIWCITQTIFNEQLMMLAFPIFNNLET